MLEFGDHQRDFRLSGRPHYGCPHIQIFVGQLLEKAYFLINIAYRNPFHALEKYALLPVSVLVGVKNVSSARVYPTGNPRDYSGSVRTVQQRYDSFFLH